ncbi:MAG: hypothetical protein ACYTE3_15810, partial [Planctomycetota bacterium]
HTTIANNGNVLIHSDRLEQSAPGMSMLRPSLVWSGSLQPTPGAFRPILHEPRGTVMGTPGTVVTDLSGNGHNGKAGDREPCLSTT